MKLRSTLFLATAALAGAACGSDSSNPPPVDDPDAAPPAVCQNVTLGDFEALGFGQLGQAVIGGTVTPTPMGEAGAAVNFEFYGTEALGDLVGTWDVSQSPDDLYSTCGNCLLVYGLDATGENITKTFFQETGTVTHSRTPLGTSARFVGSFSNVKLVEVQENAAGDDLEPVPGGDCLIVADGAVEATGQPAEWTCPAAMWADDAACDCNCGISDADCDALEHGAADVVGCAAGQNCVAAACVAAPANDTCATAVALTIDAPATNGTTVGAFSDVNEDDNPDMSCTGFSQRGDDVMYSVALAMNQTVVITMDPAAMEDLSLVVLGPGAAACDATPLVCAAANDEGVEGDTEVITFVAPSAGTYFLVVDSFYMRSPGAFSIRVTSPPP